MVPLTARKELLLQQGKRSGRTLDDPVSPLYSLLCDKPKPNRYSRVDASRQDIQKLCIKVLTLKLTSYNFAQR